MNEIMEMFVRESRKLPKRECDFQLEMFGFFLRLLSRFERRGQLVDTNTIWLAGERIQQARLKGHYWIEGVRVPSIIRTYSKAT